jgi:hypothetical protein
MWPILFNLVKSIQKLLADPVSPILCISLDDVWLGKQEIMKLLLVDPFRNQETWMVDQVALGGPRWYCGTLSQLDLT